MSGTGMPTRMACCGLTESINTLSRSRPASSIGPGNRRVASGTRLQRLTSEPARRLLPTRGGAALLFSGREQIARLMVLVTWGAWPSSARHLGVFVDQGDVVLTH